MGAHVVKTNEEFVAVVCSGRGGRRKRYYKCGRYSEYLCDYPIFRNGVKVDTCSLPMCGIHTNPGISTDIDFCDGHFELAKDAYDRRQARTEPPKQV